MAAHFGDVEQLQEQIDRLKATLLVQIKRTTALEVVVGSICKLDGSDYEVLMQEAILQVSPMFDKIMSDLTTLKDSSNTTSDAGGN